MRRNASTVLLLLLLLLPLTPLSSASGGRPVSVDGPDEDGAFALTFEVVRAVQGSAAVSLDVSRTDPDGTLTSQQSLGMRTFPVGASLFNVTYLPTQGPGTYEVALTVQGYAGEPLTFNVTEGDGTSAHITYEIPDEATHLVLTSDSVNSNGKLKSPGETLVTRARLTDGNGWADLDRVAMRIDRRVNETWVWFDEQTLEVTAPAQATDVSIDVEFARAPLAAGEYRLTLLAMKNDSAVAEVNRTFLIRDILPRLETSALDDVSPDGSLASTSIAVTDRNGFTEETLEGRIYRGSSRVEDAGFSVDLGGAGHTARVVDAGTLSTDAETARAEIPLTVAVPFGADAGTYRVSLYIDGTLVGSVPFNVLDLPEWVSVAVDETDDTLTVEVVATGDGVVTLRLDNGSATTETFAHLAEGRAVLTLEHPTTEASIPWTLTLRAREDGAIVSERSGWWNRTTDMVPLIVTAAHVSARLPATWTVSTAPDWNLENAQVNLTVLRWDGTTATELSAGYHAGRVRVDGPANIAPGRYQIQLHIVLPNGSQGTATWHLEAGPWIRLQVGDTLVDGREARIEVANAGGVTVNRFIVEVDGAPANATILWENVDGTQTLVLTGKRYHANGVGLAPNELGALVVRLPDGPLPAGAIEIQVRLLALRS